MTKEEYELNRDIVRMKRFLNKVGKIPIGLFDRFIAFMASELENPERTLKEFQEAFKDDIAKAKKERTIQAGKL